MSTLDFSKPELLQTRDGREVRIYATDGKGTYSIHGAILQEDGWEDVTWTKDGTLMLHCEGEDDLVAKPQRIKGWANAYKRGEGSLYTRHELYSSQDLAKMASAGKAVGQIYIDAEIKS